MKLKLIGVTPRVLYEDNVRKQFVNERYLTYFHKHNVQTIMLTNDCPDLESILALCDGFLITGGDDITPRYFNQANNGSKHCDEHVDQTDQKVIAYATAHQKPVLGICRGIQSLNVFSGGTLIQDIGTHHQGTRHLVKVINESPIAWPSEFEVNSYHHQVIDELAPNFKVLAIDPKDNYIEAMIHKTLPILGVQWHPEMILDDPKAQIIFDWFINKL